MELSIRMKAVADLVTPGSRLADIGTDHAYIPCYLVQKGLCPKALAMDVRKGPLEHADASIRKYVLEDRISTRLSDGAHELKAGEADSVIIAGMGGLLMVRILTEGREVLDSVSELILQPQSDIDQVRGWLHQNGYRITDEDMVFDDGKYYVMFRAVKGQDTLYNEDELIYGKLLIEKKHPVLKEFLIKEVAHADAILETLSRSESEKSKNRALQVMEEKNAIMRILASYES